MTRTAATKTYANFTGGLITEASTLSYPENAALALDNIDINENGSIQRRAGLAFDAAIEYAVPSLSNPLAITATQVYKWESVNGVAGRDIAVIQIADALYFFYIKDGGVLSTIAAAAITLTAPTRTSDSTQGLRQSSKLDFASGNGRLYVVGKYIDPMVVTFVEPATEWGIGSVSTTKLTLKIRDFKIAEEGEYTTVNSISYSVAGEEKQRAYSGAHFYNLANQGWPSLEDSLGRRIQDPLTEISGESNPDATTIQGKAVDKTYDAIFRFPTIYDQFHTNKAGGGTTVLKQTAYSPWLMTNDYVGTTPAPRGKLIKEAFYIERKAVGSVAPPLISDPFPGSWFVYDKTSVARTRPQAVAFYAGRVWYAGMEGVGRTNNVYFSQVLGDDITKAEKCYQEADPTAEVINELVATDGGLLGLEGVGKILKMYPVGSSLVIIADNGCWTISGDGEQSSFKADSFSVRRITNQGAISGDSIVFARDVIYYWGESSIIAVSLDQTGFIVASDTSSVKIKERYLRIISTSKNAIFTIHDQGANRILWFYEDHDTADFDNVLGKAFNKVLYWDISLQAFGEYTISVQPDLLVTGGFSVETTTTIDIVEAITDGGVTVTDGGDPLLDTVSYFVPEASSVRLITITGTSSYKFRFSGFTDVQNFEDWGNDFTSYVETGFDSLQDIMGKSKKAPMLQTLFERTEGSFDIVEGNLDLLDKSGCLVSYGWDWATSPYSNQFQAYKLLRNYTPAGAGSPFNYGVDVITTRHRIRGRGTSLGLRFQSEPQKDFKLLGYGMLYTTRGRP